MEVIVRMTKVNPWTGLIKWSNCFDYLGSYWTRSATSEYYYTAWNVNSGGYLSTYTVDDASHCVRPCITISI